MHTLAGLIALLLVSGAHAFIIVLEDTPMQQNPSPSQSVVVIVPSPFPASFYGPKGNPIYLPPYPINYGYYNNRVYGSPGVYQMAPIIPAPTPLQRNMGRAHYFSNK